MGRRGRLPASCLSGCKAGRCGVPGSQCWLLREESSLILLHFVQLLGQAFLFGWTFSCLLASCPGWSCYFCCSSAFEVAAAATTTTTCSHSRMSGCCCYCSFRCCCCYYSLYYYLYSSCHPFRFAATTVTSYGSRAPCLLSSSSACTVPLSSLCTATCSSASNKFLFCCRSFMKSVAFCHLFARTRKADCHSSCL